MCLAVPSQVVFTDGSMAVVSSFGVERTVSLMLLSDSVEVGDYLLIQAGGFAFERIDQDMAHDMLTEMQALLAISGDDDFRQLGAVGC